MLVVGWNQMATRKMLTLIWSKEQGIKTALIDAFHRLYTACEDTHPGDMGIELIRYEAWSGVFPKQPSRRIPTACVVVFPQAVSGGLRQRHHLHGGDPVRADERGENPWQIDCQPVAHFQFCMPFASTPLHVAWNVLGFPPIP